MFIGMDVYKHFLVLKVGFALSFFILVGCVSQPVDTGMMESDEVKRQRWVLNRECLSQLQAWQMVGRLNIKVPGRSGTMSINWRQQGDRYELIVDGPIGTSIARISGDREGVSVTASDATRYGSSPEMLLYSLTGWRFPVSNLRYWIKGLPAPGSDAKIQLSNFGYPERIEQQGWTVVYQQYGLGHSLRLPAKLTVSHEDVHLRFMVKTWEY